MLLLGTATPTIAAQDIAESRTSVRSVRFAGFEPLAIQDEELLPSIATRATNAPGFFGAVLQHLSLAARTEPRWFAPLEMARDRERLRRLFVRRGYPRATVQYAVIPDSQRTTVDIVFTAVPGEPITVRDINVELVRPTVDSMPLPQLESIATDEVLLAVGTPLDSAVVERTRTAIRAWLSTHGHLRSVVENSIVVDADSTSAIVTLRVDPGPAFRVGQVDVSGNRVVSRDALLDLLTFRDGEMFSTARLAESRARINSLDVIRTARFTRTAIRADGADSVVDIALRVEEEREHAIVGQVGYTSEAGLGGEVSWTDGSTFGSGRSILVSLTGQSGVWSLAEQPRKFVRGALNFTNPYLLGSGLRLDAGPYVEYRDDERDLSYEFGLSSTLTQRFWNTSSVSLQYTLASRRIQKYRFGDVSAGVDFLELLRLGANGVLDLFGSRLDQSRFSLSSTLSSLDSPVQPRRGGALEPSITVTVPAGLNSSEYALGSVRATWYHPFSDRVGIALRGAAAKVFPFGKSVPIDSSEGFRKYLQLRDVLLTAGGTDDVRGYADGQLGPRFPRVLLQIQDTTASFVADGFAPIAGFNRLNTTVELRMPVPIVGADWSSFLFVDGGRVWTSDSRYTETSDPEGIERFFWTSGAGIQYETVLGSIRLSLAYKLNPSFLDLASASDVLAAILDQRPPNDVPLSNRRRFRLHFGIGARL